jgi:hypothetical protein
MTMLHRDPSAARIAFPPSTWPNKQSPPLQCWMLSILAENPAIDFSQSFSDPQRKLYHWCQKWFILNHQGISGINRWRITWTPFEIADLSLIKRINNSNFFEFSIKNKYFLIVLPDKRTFRVPRFALDLRNFVNFTILNRNNLFITNVQKRILGKSKFNQVQTVDTPISNCIWEEGILFCKVFNSENQFFAFKNLKHAFISAIRSATA